MKTKRMKWPWDREPERLSRKRKKLLHRNGTVAALAPVWERTSRALGMENRPWTWPEIWDVYVKTLRVLEMVYAEARRNA